MHFPPVANARVPSRYTAPLQPSFPPQQWMPYTHEVLQPNLQDTHFDTFRPHALDPSSNDDFIPMFTSRDPQGSVQNVNPLSHPFVNNQPHLDFHHADTCPSTSRNPQAFVQTVDSSSHPVFYNQPMPDPDLLGPSSTFPLSDDLLPQASTHAAVNPPMTNAYSDGYSTTHSTTSSAGHVQLEGGQLAFTAQGCTAWSGPVMTLAPPPPPPPTLPLACYPDPAVSYPQPPSLDASLPDLGIVDPTCSSQTADSGCAHQSMRVPPVHWHAPSRRPHPFVRIDDHIEFISPNVVKMTLWFNWSPDADARAHERWD